MTKDPTPIALLTDFGLSDPYVGQLKAVILSRAPFSPILDLSHGVRPQDVLQGAFFLASSLPYLPRPGVLLAIIDPGVGTNRSILIAKTNKRLILTPDNGLLGLLDLSGLQGLWRVYPRDDLPCPTFHGRDWLGPLAASLATGSRPGALGAPIGPEDTTQLKASWAHGDLATGIQARILHIDRFGNAVLNLSQDQTRGLEPGLSLSCPELGGLAIQTASTYAAIPKDVVGLIPGSQGFWELAVNCGSLAQDLGLDLGQGLVLKAQAGSD
jgi:hypothetical protein